MLIFFDGCQVGDDEDFDWAARYEPILRALPLAAGGVGIAGVLLNRLFSGVSIDHSKNQGPAYKLP